MKSIFKSFMLVVAATIAFASCVKESETIVGVMPTVDVVFDGTVSYTSAGPATKAVRTDWEDQAEVMLVMNGDDQTGHQMKLKWDAESEEWTITVNKDAFMAMPSEGTFTAVHHTGEMTLEDQTFNGYEGGYVMTQSEVPYKILKVNNCYHISTAIELAPMDRMFQLTVEGIDNENGAWTIEAVDNNGASVFEGVGTLGMSGSTLTNDAEAEPYSVANEDGVAFFPLLAEAAPTTRANIVDQENKSITFYLTDPKGECWFRTYYRDPKEIEAGSAIKINAADIANSREWNQFNIADLKSQIAIAQDQTVFNRFVLNRAVVTYVAEGDVIFVEDETGGIELYKTGLTGKVAAGDYIFGKLNLVAKYYKGLYELTSVEGYAKEAGAEIPCTELSIAELKDAFGRYTSCRIILKDVEVTKSCIGSDAASDRQGLMFQITDGQTKDEIMLYSQLKHDINVPVYSIGDVTGYPCQFNTTQEFGLWSQEDFVLKAIRTTLEATSSMNATTNEPFTISYTSNCGLNAEISCTSDKVTVAENGEITISEAGTYDIVLTIPETEVDGVTYTMSTTTVTVTVTNQVVEGKIVSYGFDNNGGLTARTNSGAPVTFSCEDSGVTFDGNKPTFPRSGAYTIIMTAPEWTVDGVTYTAVKDSFVANVTVAEEPDQPAFPLTIVDSKLENLRSYDLNRSKLLTPNDANVYFKVTRGSGNTAAPNKNNNFQSARFYAGFNLQISLNGQNNKTIKEIVFYCDDSYSDKDGNKNRPSSEFLIDALKAKNVSYTKYPTTGTGDAKTTPVSVDLTDDEVTSFETGTLRKQIRIFSITVKYGV